MGPTLFEDYIHYVDDLKPWRYFDVPGCLRRLPWSAADCLRQVTWDWLTKDEHDPRLTRNAVIQLALHTCPPLRQALNDHMIDWRVLKDRTQTWSLHPCPDVKALIVNLASALVLYEAWCEETFRWPAFQKEREACVKFLRYTQWHFGSRRRWRAAPEDPAFRHGRKPEGVIQKAIDLVQSITYKDYQQTNEPTSEPGDRRAQYAKWMLLSRMSEAFETHTPEKWSREATYRALVRIMNQLRIPNAKGKRWTEAAVKRVLTRGPSVSVSFTYAKAPPVERWNSGWE